MLRAPARGLKILNEALPEGLTLDSALRADQTRSDLVIRSCLIRNSAGETAPFCILPGLNVDISATQVRDLIRGHQTRPWRNRVTIAAAREVRTAHE